MNSQLLENRQKLINHDLNKRLSSIDELKIFMESHSFIVWDYMSILKSLQKEFAPINIPWFPAKNTSLCRVLNEIVLLEESDKDINGNFKSHFEMYIDCMKEIGASTFKIERFLEVIEKATTDNPLEFLKLDPCLVEFLNYTFHILSKNKPHLTASLFAYSRESILANVFNNILENNELFYAPKFQYYLERHVEVDGDVHSNLAVEMVESLCGTDSKLWSEAMEVANKSISLRLKVWDSILEIILRNENSYSR